MLNVFSNTNVRGKTNKIKYFSIVSVALNNIEMQESNGYYIWSFTNCQVVKRMRIRLPILSKRFNSASS